MALLKNILELDVLKDSILLSGKHNLSNAVNSISVLEVYEKLPFIRNGELLISSLSGIKNDTNKQIETVSMLKEVNSSGLIICHVGYIISKISKELIEFADSIDFPLILSNPNLPYIDIIAPILDNILYEKNKKLVKTIDILGLFDSTTESNHDPIDIIKTLSNFIKSDVTLIDSNNMLTSTYSKDKYEDDIRELYKRNLQQLLNNKNCYRTSKTKVIYLLTPMINNSNYYGTLVIQKNKTILDHSFWTAINKAKSSLIMLGLYSTGKSEYKKRLRNDYIVELITRKSINTRIENKRAKNLDLNFIFPCIVIVLDIFNFNSLVYSNSESYIQTIKNNIILELDHYLTGRNYILTYYSDKFILIYMEKSYINHSDYVNQLINLCQYIKDMIFEKLSISITIGIGEKCKNLEDIRSSYEQALLTIKVSNMLYNKAEISTYENFKYFSLIVDSLGKNANTIANEILYPLLNYDKNNNTELIKTLKELTRNNCNTSIVANNLYVHKNTILQRKNKIIEILNFDPFTYPYRILMDLSLLHL